MELVLKMVDKLELVTFKDAKISHKSHKMISLKGSTKPYILLRETLDRNISRLVVTCTTLVNLCRTDFLERSTDTASFSSVSFSYYQQLPMLGCRIVF